MSSDDPTPTIEDRELANEAMHRAWTTYMTKIGRDPAALTPDTIAPLIAQTPALSTIAVEVEIVVARSRLKERERCAKIADEIVKDCRARKELRSPEGQAMNSTIEATAMTIAIQIRTGV